MHTVVGFNEDPGENEVPDIEDGEEDLEILDEEEEENVTEEVEETKESAEDAIAAKAENISEATRNAVLAAMHTEEVQSFGHKLPSSLEALAQIPENAQTELNEIFEKNAQIIAGYFRTNEKLYIDGAARIANFAKRTARLDGRNLRQMVNFQQRDPVQLAESLGFIAMNHDASRAKLLASMQEIQNAYRACLTLFGEQKLAGVRSKLIINSGAPMPLLEAIGVFFKIIKKGKTSKVEKKLAIILENSGSAAPVKRITLADLQKDYLYTWNQYKDGKKKKIGPGRSSGTRSRALRRGVLAAADKGEDGFRNSPGFRTLLQSTPSQISNILGELQKTGKIAAVQRKGRFHYFTPERKEAVASKPAAPKKKG